MSSIHLWAASQGLSVTLDSFAPESIDLFNQHSTLSPPIDLEKGLFEHSLAVRDVEASHAGGTPTGDDGEHASKEERSSPDQTVNEALVLEDLEDVDEILENLDDEEAVYSPPNIRSSGAHVDSSEDDSGNEETTDSPGPEHCEAPCFQETLVHALCVAMLPTQGVVNKFGGVHGWNQRVSHLIPFMSRVSSEGEAYHYLRVCQDFATVLLGPLPPYSLFALGEFGKSSLGTYLDSEKCFEHIHELVEDLPEKGVDSDTIQEFCILFYARCIDFNPDTPLLGPILDKICTATDETALKFVGPIIHRLLLLEESVSPGACEAVLESADALQHYPGFKVINVAFSKAVQHSLIELDFPCAVVCCDLIGEVAFQDVNFETISGSDDPSLVKLRSATKIVSSDDEEEDLFRFLCAVTYLRSFLSAIARFIQCKPSCLRQDGEHSMLFADVNAVISTSESGLMQSRKSAMQKFLLKDLRKRLPLHDVQDLFQGTNKLPSLKTIQWQVGPCGKLGFDPLKELSQSSEAQEALAALMVKTEDHHMRSLIKTLNESVLSGRDLLVALIKAFYYVRSVRSLRDVEEQNAALIHEMLVEEKLATPFIAFVASILGRSNFKDVELNISTASSVQCLQQTALVVHLGAILVPLSCYLKNPASPFLSYLTNPHALTGSFLLTAPDDPKVGLQTFCHYSTAVMDEVDVYLCPYGVAFANANKEKLCPVHPNHSEGDEFQVQETTNVAKELLLQGIEAKKERYLCTRDLPPVEFRMLHLLVCTAIYGGYALGLLDDSALDTFCRTARSDHQQTEKDPCKECFCLMMDDIRHLGNLLDVREEDVLQLMHRALDKVAPLLSENTPLASAAARDAWEKRFVQTVDPLLHGVETAKWKSGTGGALKTPSPCLEQEIDEKHVPIFEDVSTRNMHIPRLWRTTGPKTLDNLKAYYLNANDQSRKNHALLGLFLEYADTLPLIAHLSNLLHWSRLVESHLSRRLSRKVAKSLKIGEVIRKAGGSKEASEKRFWEDAFERFRRSWEGIRQFVVATCNVAQGMPPLSETCSITLCLVDGRDDGIYLCAALEMLQSLQNAFLQKVLAIAAKGRCPALSFLQKTDTASAISTVHLQDAREREVIHYQWSDEILRHSQRHFEYGRGNEIFYDLGKIEKELAARFLPGKAYLSTHGGLRMFVFSNELFHTCSNILTDLQQIILQSGLTLATTKDLWSLKERSLDSIQELLEHLEIVLCMLKKTGGKPQQPLVQFIDQWLSKSRPFPKHLLPEPHSDLQLQHVVSLYECLEDIFAGSSANSVPDIYRKTLPEEAVKQMSKMFPEGRTSQKADHSIISLDDIVTALCRFMYRYLSSEDMRPDPGGDSLAESMMEPSLFPMGSFKSETPQQVRRAIPESLTIGHVYSVVAFYQERLKALKEKKAAAAPVQIKGRGGGKPGSRRRGTKKFSMA